MPEEETPEEFIRVRTPRGKQLLGIVMGRMGAGRFLVICTDKKERMCRVPGKIKHRIWVKEGDIVIVEPWEIEPEKKGDIVWRYTRIQVGSLKKQGLLKDLPV